ncbi:hypothetical protein GGU45_003467 [Niabella hirudinis]
MRENTDYVWLKNAQTVVQKKMEFENVEMWK